MFAEVIGLRYWKSEHNEMTCQDAYNANSAVGLFAIADGAGTTLFSDTWARILVDTFLQVPLLSTDPFEVEWWLRLAQEQYKQQMPNIEGMAWNALQKAQSQGSYSTLATLRFTQVQENTAQAALLACGDSCILIYKADLDQLYTFPLEQEHEFLQAPICLPSKLSTFYRHFHRCLSDLVELHPGDVVLLATDAVARWIIGAGDPELQKQAFQMVIEQSPETWPDFIEQCREDESMQDDDSTVLVLRLYPAAFSGGFPLRTRTRHSKELLAWRRSQFEQALQQQNSEMIAIYYGDGVDMTQAGVEIAQSEIQHARQVADALREVLQALQQAINSVDVVARVRPVWQKHAELLISEACAENLRHTLTRLTILQPSALPDNGSPSDPDPPSQQEDIAPPGEQPLPPAIEEQVPESTVLAEYQQRLQEMEIELKLLKALRADDDAAILVASEQLEQFPHIDISQESARIDLAFRRKQVREQLRDALNSSRLEQIAKAYELVTETPLPELTQQHLRLLALTQKFVQACHASSDTDSDAILLSAYRALNNYADNYGVFFSLTEQEEQRVKDALEHQPPPTPTAEMLMQQKHSAIIDAYIKHQKQANASNQSSTQQMMLFLEDDQLIQQCIRDENIHYGDTRHMERYAIKELNNLKKSKFAKYSDIVQKYNITDEEASHVIQMLRRGEMLEQHVRQRYKLALADWLRQRKNALFPPSQSQTRKHTPTGGWGKGTSHA